MADDERAPDNSSPPKSKATSGGNIVTRKLGPLPVWGWVVLGAGGLYLLKKRSAAKSGAHATSAIGPTQAVTQGAGLPPGYTGGADNAGLDALIQALEAHAQVTTSQYKSPSYLGQQYGIKDYSALGPYANAIATYGYSDILRRKPGGITAAGIADWEIVAEKKGLAEALREIGQSAEAKAAGGRPVPVILPDYGGPATAGIPPMSPLQAPVSGVNPYPMGG